MKGVVVHSNTEVHKNYYLLDYSGGLPQGCKQLVYEQPATLVGQLECRQMVIKKLLIRHKLSLQLTPWRTVIGKRGLPGSGSSEGAEHYFNVVLKIQIVTRHWLPGMCSASHSPPSSSPLPTTGEQIQYSKATGYVRVNERCDTGP